MSSANEISIKSNGAKVWRGGDTALHSGTWHYMKANVQLHAPIAPTWGKSMLVPTG
jgi:hypothetical protein